MGPEGDTVPSTIIGKNYCSTTITIMNLLQISNKSSGGSRFSRDRQTWRGVRQYINWQFFAKKLHENERNGTEWGAESLASPWIRH